MSAAAMSRQLDELDRHLPGADSTRAARAEALARFKARGFPSRAIETWHYTDLSSFADKNLALAPAAAEPDRATLRACEDLLTELGIPSDQPCYVFVDGRRAESLSREADQADPPGLVVRTLAEQPDLLTREPGIAADSALASLNAALAADGVAIEIASAPGPEPGHDTPRAEHAAHAVHLVFIGSGRGLAPQLRVSIELAAGARAQVVQHFADLPDADEAWLNLVTDVRLAAGSALELYRLQTHGPDQLSTSLTRAELADGARLTAGNLEQGGKLVRSELEIALAGAEARVDCFGLALGRDRQHADTRWALDHRAPSTLSTQDFRAIVADSSRSIFNGKVTVREDAQHIDARQRNDNLLLSHKAEADTKPELEIYADQVVCSHGATVGELSEEELFYLRARGIDEATARGILTAAFAEKIVRQFGPDWVRERAIAIVGRWLPAAPSSLGILNEDGA